MQREARTPTVVVLEELVLEAGPREHPLYPVRLRAARAVYALPLSPRRDSHANSFIQWPAAYLRAQHLRQRAQTAASVRARIAAHK